MRAPRALIEIVDLHKSFGDNHVLRGLNLRVEEGSTLVILGASGSGKSVLLKHMIGLLRPDSGQVLVEGEDVCQLDGKELERVREKFGMVFQTSALFDSMTVLQNVSFPLRVRKPRPSPKEIHDIAMSKLRLVGLEEAADLTPAELSGGMRKRVALARAVVREPRILLYDEPTTGLDPITVASVNEMILDARRELGVTSVVISHDIESAFTVADRVAMLYKGCIIEEGRPEAFRRSPEPYVQRFLRTFLLGQSL